jgi:hypothetical protein
MANTLHDLNDLVGLFLIIIAFGIGSCAKSLAAIHKEVQCLHDDFETLHGAHGVQEARDRAKYGV